MFLMVGLFLIILAQVGYALGGFVIRKYLGNYHPLFVSAVMAITSILIFLPILIFFFKSELGGLTFKTSLPFILAGILWLVIAEILYVTGLQKSPSLALASLMTLFFPLFSTILGIVFLKEALTVKTIIAGILMIAGFI